MKNALEGNSRVMVSKFFQLASRYMTLASNLTSLTSKYFLYKVMIILAKLMGFKAFQNQIKYLKP